MIIDRGYGEPVKETDRMLSAAVEGNLRWSFNMSDGDATPALRPARWKRGGLALTGFGERR